MGFPAALVDNQAYPRQESAIVHRVAVVSGIDMTVVAATNLWTVPVGFTAIIWGALIEVTAAAGIVTAASAGVGIAAGEDDIFASVPLTGLLAAGQVWSFLAAGLSRTAPAGSIVKLGVDVGAAGGTQTARCHLLGFLFQ